MNTIFDWSNFNPGFTIVVLGEGYVPPIPKNADSLIIAGPGDDVVTASELGGKSVIDLTAGGDDGVNLVGPGTSGGQTVILGFGADDSLVVNDFQVDSLPFFGLYGQIDGAVSSNLLARLYGMDLGRNDAIVTVSSEAVTTDVFGIADGDGNTFIADGDESLTVVMTEGGGTTSVEFGAGGGEFIIAADLTGTRSIVRIDLTDADAPVTVNLGELVSSGAESLEVTIDGFRQGVDTLEFKLGASGATNFSHEERNPVADFFEVTGDGAAFNFRDVVDIDIYFQEEEGIIDDPFTF